MSEPTLDLKNQNGSDGYQGGNTVSRFITPGGHPIDNSQPAFPVFHRKFANPAPLGLMAFGGTTVLLSFFNLQTRDIHTPNVILGMALAYGGFCQFIAGIEEWACGNTFGATAFTCYGGFWVSFGCIYIPQFEIVAAYKDKEAELASALGLYLVVWGIITFIYTTAAMRSSVALLFVFAVITVTFFVLAAGEFTGNKTVTKAGGGLGIIGGFAALYTAWAGLLTKDTSYARRATPRWQN